MIIDLRGTNGSGKSTIARRFIMEHEHTHFEQGYFIPALQLFVLGHYKRPTGGLDAEKPMSRQYALITWAMNTQPNVLFESHQQSLKVHPYFSYAEYGPQKYVFAYLDTPLETCIAQRAQRRKDTGKLRYDATNDVLIKGWYKCQSTCYKLKEMGVDVRWVDHTKAYETIKSWILSQK